MQMPGYQSTPFDPSATQPIAGAIHWILAMLSGSIATSLCVIAIACLGLLMLNGRRPVRMGARVALGCFILLGAPVIAEGFMSLGQVATMAPNPEITPAAIVPPRDLPPANYDPYSGASLRQN